MAVVVINPAGAPGHGFKGLHNYCSHDQGSANTSERVDWIEMRNLATNDPSQAWKIMAATAQSQEQLKKEAGVRAGRKSQHGSVMHVVISFDKDEPSDRETISAAADDLLSKLGADPAKMRGKSKPAVKQFADEHQVAMYAHTDTDNHHVHLMINRVHPDTGRNLPTSNDQLKASDWALEFSKRHGTDHKTPAREENKEARSKGEYVKAQRRPSRNIYDLEQRALKAAANDNEYAQSKILQMREADAKLAARGRALATQQREDKAQFVAELRLKKIEQAKALQVKSNKAKADVREAYRQRWRTLNKQQEAEKKTFDALEKTLFGRAGNIVKTVKLSSSMLKNDENGILKRSFKILSNAGTRQEYFEKSQNRVKADLAREQKSELAQKLQEVKKRQADDETKIKQFYADKHSQLSQDHAKQNQAFRYEWKGRIEQREAALKDMQGAAKLKTDYAEAAARPKEPSSSSLRDDFYRSLIDDPDFNRDYSNDNERDDGNER